MYLQHFIISFICIWSSVFFLAIAWIQNALLYENIFDNDQIFLGVPLYEVTHSMPFCENTDNEILSDKSKIDYYCMVNL